MFRRAFDGNTWSAWGNLTGLADANIDARSDLDCSATGSSTDIVASARSPAGAVLHAFGLGTAFNPFVRELPSLVFGPSPSIAALQDGQFTIGVAGPGLFDFDVGSTGKELTPITGQTDPFTSSPDIALQPAGSSGLHYFAAFDATGVLAVYYHVTSAATTSWERGVKLSPPLGSFAFSPAICTENGAYGVYSVSVVAVAGGRLWHATTPAITSPFSAWTMIGTDAASSPDCAVAGGAGGIVHVVMLSASATALDVFGKGTNWVTVDLGSPP